MTALALKVEYVPSDLRVELLRDEKGIYGVGTVGDGWLPYNGDTCEIVIRPDRLVDSKTVQKWFMENKREHGEAPPVRPCNISSFDDLPF